MKQIYYSLNLIYRLTFFTAKCCILLTLFIGLNPQVTFGQVHNITQSTNFSTIQAAINDAATVSGDIIEVDAGTYTENVTVNKSLTIKGANFGTAGCGTRVAESIVAGGTGTAFTVSANDVTIDGFNITGVTGISSTGVAGIKFKNNLITAGVVGINTTNISSSGPSIVQIQNNCVNLTTQVAGANTTIGIFLNGFASSPSPILINNNTVSGAFYGFLIHNFNSGLFGSISNSTITGCMQGVAVVNTLNGTNLFPSSVSISNVSMSGFAGNYPALPAQNFTAGIYTFTAGATIPSNGITLTINNVTIDGTTSLSPSGAGIYLGDFSTGGPSVQTVTVEGSNILNNTNRGIDARGRVTINVNTSTFTNNGSAAFGTDGNDGFTILAQRGATVTASNNTIVHPATSTTPVTAFSTGNTPANTINASNNSISMNGNANAKGANNSGGNTITATCNWWGVTGANVAPLMNGVVSYETFLSSGTDSDGAVGFQPAAGTCNGCSSGGSITNTTSGKSFCTIQAAINDATTNNGDIIVVGAGTYTEDIVVSKSLDIRGPNYNVSPNGGSRVAEAIIVPATDAVVSGEIIHVAASNVSINGFTIDGNNPSLSGGANNTNGLDMNAAEGVTVYEDNINNLNVSNNIFQNLSYFGVTLYGASFSSPASSGHVVSNNKFQNLGTYTDGTNQINFWGGGVLLYNNQYAAISDNVMSNVRIGIQTGNFSRANIGTIASQLISGNTMEVRRVGVFHNLHYSLTSPYSFTNNTITALQNANETGVRGFLLGSLSVNSTLTDNNVDLTGSTATTTGIEVWNVKSTTPSIISGGIISGVNTGIFLNNYDGYNSNATDGAYATLSGMTINPNTMGTGIRLYDNPSSTHIGVEATLGAGITINNGTNGLVVENTSAKAISPTGNFAFVGQTGDYIKLINNTNNVDATAASFDGQTGATATTAQNFAIEDKIVHKIDNAALGLVRVKSAEVFVTTNSGKIQRGIDAATASDIVNVNSGTYNEQVLVNKTVSLKGSGATKPIIDFTGTVTGKPTTFDVSVDGVTIENLNFKVDLSKLRSAIIASAAGIDNITVKDNLIEPYGTPAGSYGDRNAVSINYGGSTNYRVATGGVDNISFTGNTVTFFAPVSGFRSAVAVDEGGGTFSGNTLQTINHDAIIRFGSNGDINVTNNSFNGGGVELAEQNAGAGTITVSDNIFDATFANFSAPGTAVLRLKNNQAMNPALVSGNTFSNHEWAVSLENYDLATLNNNSFTPLANSTTYHHITINTKSISSNSNTIVQTAIGGTLTNNTFNGSGTLGGTALSFQNHDSDAATFGTFTIGNVGNENIFNTGIQNFILLDGQTGSTNASTFPTYPTTGGWPTTMAAWATNLDVRNNKFDVGTGLKLPNTFSFTERNTLETLLTHKPDNAALGTISYFDPVHNLTQDTYYATIQAAVTTANANDIIQLAEATYNERVTISKSLTIQGVDKANCIVSGSGLAGFGSGFYINNGITGVTIKDLTIQNFTGNGPNGNAGVYAIGGNNNLTVKNTIIKDNVGGSGIYANGPINTVLFEGNTVSGHTNVSGAARGIVIWNGLKENITIINNEVFNNNCCGIELQEGSGTNVNVSDNNIHDNGDNGIGLIGLTGPGENTVNNNIVTNNGRFGIEIKNPNGSGANTGAGKIVISNNNITRTLPIGSEVRDIAGIAVHRRAVLSGNVDVPYGTVVSGNTVSGYTQPSNSDGFGIVMEGINHTVSGNTVSGNDVGIQRQAGHSGYPGDGDQSNLADTYFGRGNSPVTCGINLTGNILSSNTIDTRDVGNSAGQGIVVNTTTGKSFCSIQTAVNDVATVDGHTITLSSGTYNEQVLINKSLIILGVGTTKPIIDFTGTPALASGKLTAFEITVPNVTIDNLELKIDVSKIGSAIVASVALPGSVSNLKIQNNDIDPYRSSASTVAFGSRNAVNINYGSFRINTSNPTGILAQNNTISYDNGVDTTPGTTDDAGFRSGFAMDEGTGDFTGNTIQTISQDIEVRFTNSTNNINITNNNINGGGLNYAAPNVTGGTLNITGNTFDGTFGNTYSSSIRIRDNIAPNTINTVIENNTFNNHSWGISLENYGNVSVNNNTFTPLAGLTSYHHITVNTKENASSSATVGQTAIGGVFTNNIFNGSGVAGGFAMKFLNHDNNNASFGTITLGNVGNENTFNAGIANFIAFDSQTGSSNGSIFPIYPTTGDWPTTMACWNQNINIENNKFDVGSGLELPSAMNFTSRTNLESALIHKPDNSCLGSLIYFYPVKNLTQNTTFLTIQPAITAAVANDVIELSEWTFAEGITIDKSLTIQGVDSANVVLDGASIANANGITLANNIQNITIKN